MLSIDITRPYFLLLLLVLPYLYIVYKRSRYPFASKRSWWQMLIRCLMVIAIVLGLADPRVINQLERLCVIFALDISPSMPKQDISQALKWMEDKLDEREAGDLAGLVVFGSEARAIAAPQEHNWAQYSDKLRKLLAGFQTQDEKWATDIGSALALAAGLFPPGYQQKLVLISDGNHNAADMLPQLMQARAGNIKVDVLPLGGRHDKADVWIEGVYAQTEVKPGQGVDVEIRLAGNLIAEADLRLFLDGEEVQEIKVQLKGRGGQLIRYPLSIGKPGDYLISARISAPADSQPENNYGACWVKVYKHPRLLYVSNSPGSPSPLFMQLKQQLPLDVILAADLESIPLRYQNYGAIIMDNVSAFDLKPAQQQMLKDWVHDLGNGLVVIGGDSSFGAGGYSDTPLAEVLPLEMQVKERDRQKSLGVVLVLDKSKSMNGMVGARTKLEMAVAAATASLDWFQKQDLVGVVAFDTRAEAAVPLTSAANKSQVIEKIKLIEAGGKTDIYPGLELASSWLKQADVDIKHILLLSDGKSKEADFNALLGKIALDGITVSVVGVGPDCDRELLSFISQHGQGRLFLTNDYYKLQHIFFKDLQIATQSLLREGSTQPQIKGDHELLAGIGNTLPILYGYVATMPKKGSQQLIESATGEPILSLWNYGLGKAVAYTSDSGEWSRDWLTWPNSTSFWHRILNWAAQTIPLSAELTPNFELLGNTARLWVDVVDQQGRFKNGLNLQARVIGPDLSVKQLKLTQVKPGLYQAHTPIQGKGNYMVKVIQMEAEKAVRSASAGFVVPYLPEAMDIYINQPLLVRIASVTRGRILGLDDNPFVRSKAKEYKYVSLDTACFLIALFLLLLEIVGRKFYFFGKKV